jgi:PST family polysaccharide transporter
MLGRDVSRVIFLILLARMIGPADFGVADQATLIIGFFGILLDQGMSVVLIQRQQLESEIPGAAASINIAVGVVLTALTIGVAPLWSEFMHTPALRMVLDVISITILIRAGSITPRSMLIRKMQFRTIAIVDALGTVTGGISGLAVATLSANYWAVITQTVVTDITVLTVFLVAGAGYRPNLRFSQLRTVVSFSGRAFAVGLLADSVQTNVDNLLIGRYYGSAELAFYALAYRLLLVPVRLSVITIYNVLLPAFSRLAHDTSALAAEMTRAVRASSVVAVPAMALAAAAAPELVSVIFGSKWAPAIPLMQLLAIAGAVHGIYKSTTYSLMFAVGRDKLALRCAWLTTIVLTGAIVAGLKFGAFGVAVGVGAASLLLLPVEWLVRRHLLGMSVRGQVASLLPACHVAFWTAAGYLVVRMAVAGNPVVTLAVGVPVAVGVGLGALRFAHRALLDELSYLVTRLLGRGASA